MPLLGLPEPVLKPGLPGRAGQGRGLGLYGAGPDSTVPQPPPEGSAPDFFSRRPLGAQRGAKGSQTRAAELLESGLGEHFWSCTNNVCFSCFKVISSFLRLEMVFSKWEGLDTVFPK